MESMFPNCFFSVIAFYNSPHVWLEYKQQTSCSSICRHISWWGFTLEKGPFIYVLPEEVPFSLFGKK